MKRTAPLALAATLLAAAWSAEVCTAQTTVTTFSPNPAPPGALVDITIQDLSGQGFTLATTCTWIQIHAGSQTGPFVGPNLFCISIPWTVPPNGSFTLQWDQLDPAGAPVPPGRYWVKTTVSATTFGAQTVRWYCLDVQGPTEAALTVGPPALQVGQTTPFTVSAPTLPNEPYVILFGLDAMNPIFLAGFVDLCLSAPLFDVHVDTLDPAGQSSTFQFAIPNNPSLAYEAGMFQTLIIDSATNSLVDTNAVSLFVAP